MKARTKEKPQSFTSITLEYGAVNEISAYLDAYSRLLVGQYGIIPEIMGSCLYSPDNYPDVRDALLKLRETFIPSLKGNNIYALHGIWSPYSPERAIEAFDIRQALQFQMDAHARSLSLLSNANICKMPYFHGWWSVTEAEIEYCHAILNTFQYPGYKDHCSLTQVWSIPCVIAEYNDDAKTIRLDVKGDIADADNSEIIQIILDAKKVFVYLQTDGLAEAFRILYPKIDIGKYESLLDETSRIIRAFSLFDMDGF